MRNINVLSLNNAVVMLASQEFLTFKPPDVGLEAVMRECDRVLPKIVRFHLRCICVKSRLLCAFILTSNSLNFKLSYGDQ